MFLPLTVLLGSAVPVIVYFENCYSNTLGKLYLMGEDVPKDIGKSLEYLKASAGQGNQFAEYTLGKLYLQGKEVEQDLEIAKDFLTRSAAQGNEYAQFFLDHFDWYTGKSPSAFLSAPRLLRSTSEDNEGRFAMETALKELTIIDDLGMIVPGTTLMSVLLLNQPNKELWESIANSNSVLKLIVLLTAGYIAGMLLHEIGDILEKILWNCALLDPRCHAAKAIEKNDYSLLRTLGEKSARDSELLEAQRKKEEKDWLTVVKKVGRNAICGIILAVLIMFSFGGTFRNGSAVDCLLLIVMLYLILMWVIVAWIFEKSLPETVKNWVRENAAIQTLMVGKENEARRRMFDGFYVMMRNLLLAIIFYPAIYSMASRKVRLV